MGLQSLHPKQFLALLSAVLSLVLLSSGIVTWVAANWQSISPNLKLIAVQAILLLIGAVLLAIRFRSAESGQQRSPAVSWWYQGLAFLGAVVSGALLALVGQIYQSGADTWQLFALWFLLILPWLAFSPSVFIAALGAVVANTAAALFLMHNQLPISQPLATYGLAFLNAVFFALLEQKRAKQESLWAVLSTSILICAIVIFSVARAEDFQGAFALHMLIAAGLLMVYNKVSKAPLRLKVLAVMVLASSLSAYLLENAMDNRHWMSGSVQTLVLLGVVWVAATLVILQLWRSDTIAKQGTVAESLLHKVLPVSISVFLSLSIVLVAVFFYMSFLMSRVGAFFELPMRDIVASVILLFVVFALYIGRATLMSYVFLVLYQMVVLLAIENNYLHYGGAWSNSSALGIPIYAQILTVIGLFVSVLIYRRRRESWIRFISSLGFFVFLEGIRHLPFFSHFAQETFLFPLVFIVLMWWSFRRSSEVPLPLISALILWGIKVVTVYYGFYISMYMGPDKVFAFKNVLLAFRTPFWIFSEAEGLSMRVLAIHLLAWTVNILATLLPLWALLQIVKNRGVAATVVAVLMGLLVAWLWFARIEVLVPFALMVLAYYLRSHALYYVAGVLGLLSLSQFYFSLFLPLNQKVYLLLLNGGLFLMLYLFSFRWLLAEEGEQTEADKVVTSNLPTATEPVNKHRIIPSRRGSFLAVLAGAVLLPILLTQWQVQSYERVLANGQSVLLRLSPVDPRSLMQGDYMIINYEVNDAAQAAMNQLFAADLKGPSDSAPMLDSTSPELLLDDALKERLQREDRVPFLAEVAVVDGVAEGVRAFYEVDQAKSLPNSDELVYLPFLFQRSEFSMPRVSPRFSTEFFFSEEAAADFEAAKFAEIAVDRGRVMLRALLDIERRDIGAAR